MRAIKIKGTRFTPKQRLKALDLIFSKQAAKILGTTQNAVRRMVKKGNLSAVVPAKSGRALLFRRQVIEELAKEKEKMKKKPRIW